MAGRDGAMSTPREIRERRAARSRFTLAEVRRWMADDGDLRLWAEVYPLLGPGWSLIRPEPDMDETCTFLTRYLLRCVREDVDDEGVDENGAAVFTGYDAARELAACVKRWAGRLPETHPVLTDAAERTAAAYRAADEAERERLVNGMLEHALEEKSVRPFFDAWRDDPALREPWRLAMAWAVDPSHRRVGFTPPRRPRGSRRPARPPGRDDR